MMTAQLRQEGRDAEGELPPLSWIPRRRLPGGRRVCGVARAQRERSASAARARPCGAAQRGASVAQPDTARLDAARCVRSPQMPKKQNAEEVAEGRRSKKLSSETARRVISNLRRSIEDARLKPLHHPGKQALLDPGSGIINKGATREEERKEHAVSKPEAPCRRSISPV